MHSFALRATLRAMPPAATAPPPIPVAYDDSTACERRAARAAEGGADAPRGCHSGDCPPEGTKVREEALRAPHVQPFTLNPLAGRL